MAAREARATRGPVQAAGPDPSRRGRRASLEDALPLYRDMLGLPLETIMDIETDRVRIAFLGVGESKVELVQPTDDTTASPASSRARARASTTSASRSTTSPRR